MANPYWDILNAVKTRLNLVTSIPTVDIRYDIAQFDAAIDTLPLVIIAPAIDRIQNTDGTFGGKVIYDFPVDVVLIHGTGRQVKDGLQTYLQLEWNIQESLFQPKLTGVSEVYDTNQAQAVVPKLPAPNLRVRGWAMNYRIRSDRIS